MVSVLHQEPEGEGAFGIRMFLPPVLASVWIFDPLCSDLEYMSINSSQHSDRANTIIEQ